MCIVIDKNTIGSVFKSSAGDHSEFEPVLDWILNGKGKIVWGGSKYKYELGHCKKGYLAVFSRLGRMRKTVVIPAERVDVIEEKLKQKFQSSQIDDHHIASIIIASKCKVICSKDGRADKFLKNPHVYYQTGADIPSIYRCRDHKHLLNEDNIVGECIEDRKLTKDERDSILALLKCDSDT